jgi:DNA-binding response OmpR family regulator
MVRILVAEDVPEMAEVFKRALELGGFTVFVAPDGPTALDIALSGQVDIVLLDIRLPGRDGISVLRAIRAAALPRHLPVVVLTAFDSPEERARGLAAGADEYYAKPVSMIRLVPHLLDLAHGQHPSAS